MKARFVLSCTLAAEAALDAMARYFTSAGYVLRGREPGVARLLYAAGAPLGGAGAPSPATRHRLRLKSDGTRVVAVFASPAGPLTPESRKAFGDRVRAAAAASLGAAAGPVRFKPAQPKQAHGGAGATPAVIVKEKLVERQIVVTRCKFCGKLTPVDAQACQGCGAQSFA